MLLDQANNVIGAIGAYASSVRLLSEVMERVEQSAGRDREREEERLRRKGSAGGEEERERRKAKLEKKEKAKQEEARRLNTIVSGGFVERVDPVGEGLELIWFRVGLTARYVRGSNSNARRHRFRELARRRSTSRNGCSCRCRGVESSRWTAPDATFHAYYLSYNLHFPLHDGSTPSSPSFRSLHHVPIEREQRGEYQFLSSSTPKEREWIESEPPDADVDFGRRGDYASRNPRGVVEWASPRDRDRDRKAIGFARA